MKSSEIAAIILIMILSGLSAFFVVKSFWGSPSEKTHTVQYMDEISDEFVLPSSDIFNKNAINPTTQIIIGEDKKDDIVNYGEDINANNEKEKREAQQSSQESN